MTTDVFIVLISNVLAVLGLRSLYFLTIPVLLSLAVVLGVLAIATAASLVPRYRPSK